MLAIGYPTRAYKLLSFTIAGAFAGLAGGLYAIFNSFISPDAIYWTASGDILIMTMLGGAGTLIGPAIGAGIFLLMKNVVSSYSEHWLAIIGAIFICCVLFFPGGIWGALRQIPIAGGASHERAAHRSSLPFVRQSRRHQRRQPHRRGGRASRHHRPERRRQDQPRQPDRRPARAQRRPDLRQGHRHHRLVAEPHQPPGRRAHVSAQQPVPESQRGREPAARRAGAPRHVAQLLHAGGGGSHDLLARAEESDAARASRRATERASRAISPTASSASSRSALRSPASPTSCCWTSRPRACRRPRPAA